MMVSCIVRGSMRIYTYGNHLGNVRSAVGMTQRHLAAVSGVHFNTIYLIEKHDSDAERTIRLDVAQMIARALKRGIYELFPHWLALP